MVHKGSPMSGYEHTYDRQARRLVVGSTQMWRANNARVSLIGAEPPPAQPLAIQVGPFKIDPAFGLGALVGVAVGALGYHLLKGRR